MLEFSWHFWVITQKCHAWILTGCQRFARMCWHFAAACKDSHWFTRCVNSCKGARILNELSGFVRACAGLQVVGHICKDLWGIYRTYKGCTDLQGCSTTCVDPWGFARVATDSWGIASTWQDLLGFGRRYEDVQCVLCFWYLWCNYLVGLVLEGVLYLPPVTLTPRCIY